MMELLGEMPDKNEVLATRNEEWSLGGMKESPGWDEMDSPRNEEQATRNEIAIEKEVEME